jgi:2-dehydropantoate 2-reductase
MGFRGYRALRICIFGAGAVGSFLAARLGHAGFDVSAVARGAQLAALQTNGIRLEESSGTIQAAVKASADPSDLGIQDAVIFTTKAHSLSDAATLAAPLIGPDTALVFAQNGIPWWYGHGFTPPGLTEGPLDLLDPGSAIWNGFTPERAIGAVIHSPNTVIAPGVVQNKANRPAGLPLGEPKGGASASTQRISEALEAANIHAPILPDIRREVWSKLILNIAGAPGCSLTGASVKGFLQDEGMRAAAAGAMREAVAVAAAHGFDLVVDIEANTDPDKRPDHKSSMLQDLEAGRQMEVDPIVGSVVHLARAAGVPTPTLDILLPLLRMRARTLGLYSS